MEIITNNYKSNASENNNEAVKKYNITCEHCESELAATKEDMHIGWLGAYHITCPCCGKEVMVDEVPGINLTIENVQFPQHFYKTDVNNATEILPDEINREIHNGIDFFRNNKDEWAWYVSFGNMFMAMYKNSGDSEYHIVITKDYYETDINFEETDY